MKTKLWILIIFIILFQFNPILANDVEDEEEEEAYIEEINKELVEAAASPSDEPIINSKYAVVIDRKSKRVLYSKSKDEKTPMASTTKIMTCILALEKYNINEMITVSKRAASTRRINTWY